MNSVEGENEIRAAMEADSDEDEDFYEFDDMIEDIDLGNKLNSLKVNGTGPNSQVPAGMLHYSAKSLRSGEGQIQLHLDSLGDRGVRRDRDRADRATVEQVLDPRTRLILFRLIQRGVFDSLEGCISTGKEANVYHAICKTGESLAVKVYKTSILTFKDRDRYVTGEFRYRNGYARHNPRKMVATWAEKEMRNLQRMHQAGLNVPKAHLLKSHVLVMDFVGENGWPAPLLKNAEFDHVAAEVLYVDCVWMMRRLYRECRLVHADLSEYNMLYHNSQSVIIDVSQSVEHDHPNSLQFLRSDITNITRFFNGRGAPVLTPQRVFEVIADPTIDDAATKRILDEECCDKLADDQYLFLNVYIPHKLDNIEHFERDALMEKQGVELNNPYQKILAKVIPKKDELKNDQEESDDSGSYVTESSNSENEDEEEDERTYQEKHQKYVRVRGESLSTKRERKKAVQNDKREKRAVKTPKHIKKRKDKQRIHRMMRPNDSMTRSCITPKDRAKEVAKRREEQENERKRQLAERIRMKEERMAKAVERNQKELSEKKTKSRSELEHLREVAKRREEREERERAQKQAMLAKKNLAVRPPVLNNPRAVAFGSTAPRRTALSKDGSSIMTRSVSYTRPTTKPPRSVMSASIHPAHPIANAPGQKRTNRFSLPLQQSTPKNVMRPQRSPKITPIAVPKPAATPKPRAVSKSTVDAVAKSNAVTKPLLAASTPKVDVTPNNYQDISPIESHGEVILPSGDPKHEQIVDIDTSDSGNASEEASQPLVPYHTRTTSEESGKTRTISPISEPEEVNSESIESTVTHMVDEVIENVIETPKLIVDEVAKTPELVDEVAKAPEHVEEAAQLSAPVVEEMTKVTESVIEKVPEVSEIVMEESDQARESVVKEVPQDLDSILNTTPETELHTSSQIHKSTPTSEIKVDSLNELSSVFQTPGRNNTTEWFSANEETPNTYSTESTLKNESNATNPVSTNNSLFGVTDKMQQERENRQAKLQAMLSKISNNGNSESPISSKSEARSALWVKELISKRIELNQSADEKNQSFNLPKMEGPASPLNTSEERGLVSLADELSSLKLNGSHSFTLPGQMPNSPMNGVGH
ncbi:Serine/threonine-protein kinase RIO1 [Aphelenchoides besseyi]|nr:Serine/threonine-protein kinase RIO1 [Aphelenchoides besseyi]